MRLELVLYTQDKKGMLHRLDKKGSSLVLHTLDKNGRNLTSLVVLLQDFD